MKRNPPSGSSKGVTTGNVHKSKRIIKHEERDLNSVISMTDVDLFQAVQGNNLSIYANCVTPYLISTYKL